MSTITDEIARLRSNISGPLPVSISIEASREVVNALLDIAETAECYVRADERGDPWPAPALTLRSALNQLIPQVDLRGQG